MAIARFHILFHAVRFHHRDAGPLFSKQFSSLGSNIQILELDSDSAAERIGALPNLSIG